VGFLAEDCKSIAAVVTSTTQMSASIQNSKAALREQIRALLKTKTSEQRVEASVRARLNLEQQQIWREARVLFFYAPLPEELDIWPQVEDSLKVGKIVCLPRFDQSTGHYQAFCIEDLTSDLVTGRFGIREPGEACAGVPLNQLDLVLVPGVAFDLRGRRLGRGKGFYDRLLADAGGLKCGVAFDEQIVTEIPVEPHDVSVDCILTPTRWIQP
jgi:5-formyltetrahydrofolate cyclo-ligase